MNKKYSVRTAWYGRFFLRVKKQQFFMLCCLCDSTLHNVCSTGIASVITAITKTPNAERPGLLFIFCEDSSAYRLKVLDRCVKTAVIK